MTADQEHATTMLRHFVTYRKPEVRTSDLAAWVPHLLDVLPAFEDRMHLIDRLRCQLRGIGIGELRAAEPDRWCAFQPPPDLRAALAGLTAWSRAPSADERDRVAEWAETVFRRLSRLEDLRPLLHKLQGDAHARSVLRRRRVGDGSRGHAPDERRS